jgi:cell division septal protein FtsQ
LSALFRLLLLLLLLLLLTIIITIIIIIIIIIKATKTVETSGTAPLRKKTVRSAVLFLPDSYINFSALTFDPSARDMVERAVVWSTPMLQLDSFAM